jgi:hypothetical protein
MPALYHCLSSIFDDDGSVFLICREFVTLNEWQKNIAVDVSESH